MEVIINPGSGSIDNATEENAIENIKHFIIDCNFEKADVRYLRYPIEDGEGRYGFILFDLDNTRCHSVEMPGIPLADVRYIGDPQDPWDFPRLYIDYSSWLWKFGLLNDEDFTFDEETD